MAKQKSILITGAAGGLGKALVNACRISFPDYIIVATDISAEVESISDGQVLGVITDVTNEDSILALQMALEKKELQVWAILNNAGISDFFPITEKDKSSLEKIFAINSFGPVNMIRTFLPHLIESHGRVVNISSESVRLPTAFHPYAASKIALEALSVSMRNELALYGIPLIIIRPGAINTPFLEDLYTMKDRIGNSIYKKHLRNFAAKAPEEIHNIETPQKVAEVIIKALSKAKPKCYYHVNNNPKLRIAAFLPHRVRDYFMQKMLKK